MNHFAGVDLGKRMNHIKVLGADREVAEDLKIENDPAVFRGVFGKYGGSVEVACEASSNAFWLADTLEPIVPRKHVDDTKKIRWIAEARIKTDRMDAGFLAKFLSADLFPRIAIPPRRVRDLREMVRGIVRLRRQAVRFWNQVQGLPGR